MSKGWHGKLLRVDLSAGTCSVEALNEQWAKQYLGGRGLASKYLVEEVAPETDPLSAANKLIFATVTSRAHPEALREFLYSLDFK